MSDVVRLAMWSGPRNISTAMKRAFENRSDAIVVDEPLYAAYLARTGIDHPRARFRNVRLIRDPVEVVASYVRARDICEPDDIGLAQEGWLPGLWDEHELEVPRGAGRSTPPCTPDGCGLSAG